MDVKNKNPGKERVSSLVSNEMDHDKEKRERGRKYVCVCERERKRRRGVSE